MNNESIIKLLDSLLESMSNYQDFFIEDRCCGNNEIEEEEEIYNNYLKLVEEAKESLRR